MAMIEACTSALILWQDGSSVIVESLTLIQYSISFVLVTSSVTQGENIYILTIHKVIKSQGEEGQLS